MSRAEHAEEKGAGRFVRLGNDAPASVPFTLDGEPLLGRPGESVLAAVLASRRALRRHEFDNGLRAGFCLMGACQDCWMWCETGERLRACSTSIAPGMALRTAPPNGWPAHSAL